MARSFRIAPKLLQQNSAVTPTTSDLALGELEALARALLAVFLALFHARIAREKTVGAQRGAKLRVVARDGARKTHANRSGLPADATAVGGAHHIDLVGQAGELERLGGVMLPCVIREILFRGAAVDGELAAASAQKYASDGLFTASGAHDPNFCAR